MVPSGDRDEVALSNDVSKAHDVAEDRLDRDQSPRAEAEDGPIYHEVEDARRDMDLEEVMRLVHVSIDRAPDLGRVEPICSCLQ